MTRLSFGVNGGENVVIGSKFADSGFVNGGKTEARLGDGDDNITYRDGYLLAYGQRGNDQLYQTQDASQNHDVMWNGGADWDTLSMPEGGSIRNFALKFVESITTYEPWYGSEKG